MRCRGDPAGPGFTIETIRQPMRLADQDSSDRVGCRACCWSRTPHQINEPPAAASPTPSIGTR